MQDTYRIRDLENKTFSVPWYETVWTGTTGTIAPPTGGTVILNQWGGNVSAICSTMTPGQTPTGITARTSAGVDISVTISTTGRWALSGTPSAYPVAILYFYSVPLFNFDSAYTMGTAVGMLSRLAAGAANLKLFMNAGATAPEWAAGFNVSTLTRAMDGASADVSYTGVGFKPGLLLFSGAVNSGAIISYFGAAHGAVMGMVAGWPPGNFTINSSYCILLAESTTKYQTAIIKTFDADGFTLTWARTGETAAGTAKILYVAAR